MKYTGERCIPELMKNRVKIYQHHLNRYSFSLQYVFGRKVLDASCGSGFGTDIIYDLAEEVLGVDISEEAIEYAKNRYRGRFEKYDLNKEFPDEDFDIVVSFETIEHLDNPDFFLENIKKKAKGFIFSIPISTRISAFHKKAYQVKDAIELMEKHFDKKSIRWFSQGGKSIVKGLSTCNYVIGAVSIKPQGERGK